MESKTHAAPEALANERSCGSANSTTNANDVATCTSAPSQRPHSPQDTSRLEMELALVNDFLASYESDSLSSDCEDSSSSSNSDHEPRNAVPSALATAAAVPMQTARTAALAALPAKLKFANSHARRKHEMATLRRQKDELTDLLARLQHAVHSTTSSSSKTATTATPRATVTESTALLSSRQLAERLLTQRKRAERENEALRASALDHKRMAKTLQRILLKRVAKIRVRSLVRLSRASNMSLTPLRGRQVMEDRLRFVPPPSRTEVVLASDQATVFMRLLQDVDTMCERSSSALAAMAQVMPADSPSSFRKWRVEGDAAETLRLQVVHCNEVPFRKAAFDDATRLLYEQAMRTCSIDPQVRSSSQRRCILVPPSLAHALICLWPQIQSQRLDVRMTESRARYVAPHATGVYRVRHASRAFVCADRTLLVSAAYVDAVDGDTPLPGVMLKDEQWCLVTERPGVNAATGADETTTRIETISRIAPAHARPRFWTRATVEHELIPAWDLVITFAHQAIENKLVDEMMRAMAPPRRLRC